ncbi:hypothetical protein DFH07DRAFT_964435 [Mycena maculata]|uniref:Uncharacterized protein n=1 Tax=Mycena maculata TaxID=230809 RepID=A0AAD7II28_9AGAR|nr:hypothetical protein DFH07DRAFT_964435 [Mycena maculata]
MRPPGGRTWLTLTFIICHIPFLLVQARLQPPRVKHNTIGRRDGLTSASWIWTSAATTGNVAFLNTFDSAAGKTATSATISMAAVNQFTLWVNGQPIGASNDWQSAQVFSAALNASTNTFSVLAVNNAITGSPPPGLVAAIQIAYSDGSGDTVVSDSSWTVSAVIPSDFPTPATTSAFTPATVAAAFGSGAWGNSVTLAAATPNVPSLSASTWIWSTSGAASNAAVGTVGFRKTVATPSGKTAQSATLLVTADNGFNLYVNGDYVGSSPGVPVIPDFRRAQQFTVGLDAASNTFTIFGENIPNAGSTSAGPAGVLAAITIVYSDGSTSDVTTDTSWLTGPFTSVAAFLSTTDSALSPTFGLGLLGVQPWGALTGTSNVLAAANVPSGPFTSGTVPAAPSTGGAVSTSPVAQISTATGPASAPASVPSLSGTSTALGSSVGNVNTSSPSPAKADTSPSTGVVAGPSAVPIGAIVGLVIGVLVMIAAALALFFWRRKRNPIPRSERLIGPLFVATDHGLGRADDASSVAPSSQRTSLASVRRAEMASLPPQRAVMYAYPQTSVMTQGGYPQPHVMAQDRYPQPPVMAQGGYPQPPAMAQGGYPVMVQSNHNHAQSPVTSGPPTAPLSDFPLPPSTASSPTSPPLSKIERENMLWQNNAAASNPSSIRMSVATTARSSLPARLLYAEPDDEAAYGGLDPAPEPDTEGLAPPSYYAQ